MSFLHWMGGKSKTLPQIAQYLPKQIANYHEPFLGGGSVLLHTLQAIDSGEIELTGKVIAGDINESLIITFQAIKDDAEGVVSNLETLCMSYDSCPPDTECKKHYCVCCCKACMYHSVRTLFNIYRQTPILPETQSAAMFLFLNATCYRGLYRESKAGAFNTCYWSSRPLFPKSDRILEAGRLFRKYDVQFVATKFKEFWNTYLQNPEPNDLCYIDPPFVKESKSRGTDNELENEDDTPPEEQNETQTETPKRRKRKTKPAANFDEFQKGDMEWLFNWTVEHESAMRFIISCHHSDEVRSQFAHWANIHSIDTRRTMSYKGTTNTTELVICNIPQDMRVVKAQSDE